MPPIVKATLRGHVCNHVSSLHLRHEAAASKSHMYSYCRITQCRSSYLKLTLLSVMSLYNFHWFIDHDLSSVRKVTASAALNLFDNEPHSRLLRNMNTKLHVVTNHNTVLFIVDVVIIFNRALRQLEFGPSHQRIGFNLRSGNVGFLIKKIYCCAFFRVIPGRLNFIFRLFGTLCSETSAYKIKRWGITPKKHTTFRTQRRFEIKKLLLVQVGLPILRYSPVSRPG